MICWKSTQRNQWCTFGLSEIRYRQHLIRNRMETAYWGTLKRDSCTSYGRALCTRCNKNSKWLERKFNRYIYNALPNFKCVLCSIWKWLEMLMTFCKSQKIGNYIASVHGARLSWRAVFSVQQIIGFDWSGLFSSCCIDVTLVPLLPVEWVLSWPYI